jgi:hypothetical protein
LLLRLLFEVTHVLIIGGILLVQCVGTTCADASETKAAHCAVVSAGASV